MRTLTEIKKSLIAFYSNIQTKINDFSLTSVVNNLFFAFAFVLEDVYRKVEEIRRQAYIATATGKYLNRLIEGTFYRKRRPATRSSGYVVVYANNIITEPEKIELKYANYNSTLGEFEEDTLNYSTKFIAYTGQGENGVVFSLVSPKNTQYVNAESNTINLQNRNVQYLILPVVSVEKGSVANVPEGSIYTFPNPPQGIAGVLNTSNPGKTFFNLNTTNVSSPVTFDIFTSTELISLVNGQYNTFSVVNAFSFRKSGLIEIRKNTSNDPFIALYTERPITDPLGQGQSFTSGLFLEYVDVSTFNIVLKNEISQGTYEIPFTKTDGTVINLKLRRIEYNNDTITADETTPVGYEEFLQAIDLKFRDNTADSWVYNRPLYIEQRQLPINDAVIFDPDNVLDENYRVPSAQTVSGATDEDTDAQYRENLRKYLAGLARATTTAIVSGASDVTGVVFAKTLPKSLSPRGTVVLIAAESAGTLSAKKRRELIDALEDDYKAGGIELIVKAPDLNRLLLTVNVNLETLAIKDAVKQQINKIFSDYLINKLPGDTIRYTDLLTQIADIQGVTNVFNMIITKSLSDRIYLDYKKEYNYAVLNKAYNFDSRPNTLAGSVAIDDTDYEIGSVLTSGLTASTTGVDAQYLVVNTQMSTSDPLNIKDFYVVDLDDLGVGSKTFARTLYSLETDTYDDFELAITLNRDKISIDEDDFIYFCSYILGEPIDYTLGESLPINPSQVLYERIKDYTSAETEVFRPASIILDEEVKLLVGLKFTD